MPKSESINKNVGLFAKDFALFPEKLKKERLELKDRMFAFVHKVSITTVRNYMGPPEIIEEEKLSKNDISSINSRRRDGEYDMKIALEYSMSSSTLNRLCGSRRSLGIGYANKTSVIEVIIPPMIDEPKKSLNYGFILTEKERDYEKSWEKNCVDTCGPINISPYKK